ncbi:MFS transporter [Paraburkholderia acidiphila]|uniref:MFS transporter n=1 Tax=Paraburkholderia acidiphila TaxID=2571747 RepID=A0A7Z2GAM4_9BURK|nr:MFS transporter [Paraburkholderia acidiphila]QGZ58172.1 MFS transporter [Paraburkholderia acidiphila]
MPTPTNASLHGQDRPHAAAQTWALAVAQLVSWGTIYYAFSLFVVPMEAVMGWSRTATNAALSAGLLVSGFAAYPVGTLIDRGYGRRVMMGGTLLASTMLVVWAQARNLPTLFAVWCGLGVAIAATLYDPVFAVVTRDFPRSYARKITLITLVAGFASTVFIPLTQGLIGAFGWRGALLALALVNLVVCLPVHGFAIHRGERDADIARKESVRALSRASARNALRSPAFWALAVCFTAYYSTFVALTFHLIPLMHERAVAGTTIIVTMAAIGPAQVLARVAWFGVGRHAAPGRVAVAVTAAFPCSIAILMGAGSSPAWLLLFAIVYGGANGMMTILRGTIVQALLGTEGYGAVSGLLSMPANIAKGIAPIAGAAIWAIRGSYVPVEWTVLIVSLIATAACVVAVQIATPRISDKESAASGRRK